MMSLKLCVIGAAVVMVCLLTGRAWAGEPQAGLFETQFTGRTPAAAVANLKMRFGERRVRDDPDTDYEIADIKWTVYVPEKDFRPTKKFGVLVWLSDDPAPTLAPEYQAVMAEHDLIWIAPQGGLTQPVWHVYGFALDAVHNLRKQYRIDTKRLHVGGVGDGGRLGVRIAIANSDVFGGAMASGSLDWFRRVDFPSNALMRWPEAYNQPSGNALGLARQNVHFALYINPHESRDTQYMATIYKGMGELRFRNIHTIDVATTGIMPTPDEWRMGVAWMQGKTPVIDKTAPPADSGGADAAKSDHP